MPKHDVYVRVDTLATDDAVVVEAMALIDEVVQYKTTASSKRDPGDPVNTELGVTLAAGRAIRQLGRDMLREAQAQVREQDKAKKSQEAARERAREKKQPTLFTFSSIEPYAHFYLDSNGRYEQLHTQLIRSNN